jgi:uncharacterized UPF0160 family protein
VEKVYLAVYKHFMEAIDAIDNGQTLLQLTSPTPFVVFFLFSGKVPTAKLKSASLKPVLYQ